MGPLHAETPVNPPQNVTTNFESKKLTYSCINCGELPVSHFSKSKINQFDRFKISIITCNICTSKAVADDENEKSGAKELRIRKIKAISLTKRECDVGRKSDPSALYESNPLDAPIIHDAMQYFEGRSMIFKIHLGKVKAWRTIAKLAARGELFADDNADIRMKKIITSIGLFQPGTHKVIRCLMSEAHHPSINVCVNAVARACESLNINGYIEGSGCDQSECLLYKSYLKYILMAVERETGKVQLSLVWNTAPSGNEDGDLLLGQLVELLSTVRMGGDAGAVGEESVPLLHSIWVNYNAASRYNNAITCHDDDAWSLLFGKPQIKEKVRTDMRKPPALRFPPLVFRQANIDAFGNIVQNIRHWVKEFTTLNDLKTDCLVRASAPFDTDDKVDEAAAQILIPRINCVELYAGVGTIGLNCLDLFSSLHCSDENPHNKKCFDATLAKMSKNYHGRAVYESKGAMAIAKGGGLKGYDVVIVDPPRKGLDDDVIDALLTYYHEDRDGSNNGGFKSRDMSNSEHGRLNNRRLIYVSCGFKAFKRDVARLLGEEWSPPSSIADSNGWVGAEYIKHNNQNNKLTMSTGHDMVNQDIGDQSHYSGAGSKRIRHWKLVHAEGHVLFPGSDHIETFAVFDRLS